MTTPQAYILPSSTVPLPGSLTPTQFIQTVFTGVSGLPGQNVRPAWQVEPAKQPDIEVDWISIGISTAAPDTYSYVGVDANGDTISQRHETLEISCSIYGPNSLGIAGLIRDGFQIPTNLSALYLANMGFIESGPIRHVPDFVNERWINRTLMSVFLRREVQRTYPVLTLLSANGNIYVPDINADYMLAWNVQQ